MFKRLLEADEAAEEGVVAGVGVAGLGAEEGVELGFGIGKAIGRFGGHFQAAALEAAPDDGEEAGLRRDLPCGVVGEATLDEFEAGEMIHSAQKASTAERNSAGVMAG